MNLGHQQHASKAQGGREIEAAFTLLELLVSIAIIAILAALLLPVLGHAKGRAVSLTCLNNERQLGLATLLYSDEFNGRLPYNLGVNEIQQTEAQGTFLNWSTPIMDWETVSPPGPGSDNTNSVLMTAGGVGPYTSRNSKVYKCPSDNVVSDIQAALGWTARVRTISMNAMMGDAGQFSQSGANVNNPDYVQFFKITQVPKPSQIFVFIEEHPNTISDGYFLNQPAAWKWTRLPASWHQGAANLSFTDGHIEAHRWLCASTKPPVKPGVIYPPFRPPKDQTADFYWLMERTSTETAPAASSGW
jgi:prepilin-type N-terminal cleavage/methylation domain-containing protein/prepilin-type processing-associated H-X9-DG protein